MEAFFLGYVCFSEACIVDFDWPPERLIDRSLRSS